jgi:CheY-like chemotaxis protein
MERMIRRLIGEDVALTTTTATDVARVRIDPGQLEQVVMNLAVNSRDAMPSGGHLTIDLANVELTSRDRQGTALAPGEYVRLSVSDTGCGMTEDVKARVFEPFFTTKSEGRGTGLGLATVYGIVDHAGGTIAIDTAPGAGSTFRVYLPAAQEAETSQTGAVAHVQASGTGTVLLVEDEQAVAAVVAIGLRKAGYAVLQASDARQALAIASARPGQIDVLLTDVVLPGMNGRELSDRIVQFQRQIRVLFMSGYSDDAVLQRGVKASSVAFIQKPFSVDALTARLREILSPPSPSA